MGMRTIIYGCIETWGPGWGWEETAIDIHNEAVINSLPLRDKWPPVSREMFAICKNSVPVEGPLLAYSDSKIIHFGASLKSVEYEWMEWRVKFEKLLDNLIWCSANVHLDTEYLTLQTHSWHVDLKKYNPDYSNKQIQLIKRDCWEYKETLDWTTLSK